MPIIAAIQYRPRFATNPADVADNFRLCEPLINQAASLGVQMLVFPELAMTGYSFLSVDDAIKVAEKQIGPTFDRMADVAKTLKCYVVWGFVEATDEDRLYNSVSIAGPDGDLILNVRKTDLWGNDFLWADSSDDFPNVVKTDLGWMSAVVCRDVLDKKRVFSGRKVDIVAVPMNWSGGGFPSTDWVNFVKNNSCAIVAANRWGEENNRSFKHDFGQGGSVIIEKNGKSHIGGLKFGSNCCVAAMIDT